jgi:hypothetical protein
MEIAKIVLQITPWQILYFFLFVIKSFYFSTLYNLTYWKVVKFNANKNYEPETLFLEN